LPARRFLTLGDLWKKFDAWIDTERKSAHVDRSRWRQHIAPRLASITLQEITPAVLERLKTDLARQGYSHQTQNHVLALIRAMFNKARLWNLYKEENPVSKLGLKKPDNKRERFLSRAEAEKLLEELAKVSPRLRNIALLSLHTGMRVGEIFALRWSHVDLDNALIHIADAKAGSRTVYMTDNVKRMLQNLEPKEPSHLVFPGREGKQSRWVSNAFASAVKRLGFNKGITDRRQKVVFHTLRHTFASWLAMNGTPIMTIRELMGHKSVIMCERYAKLAPEHVRDAVRKFEDEWGNADPQ